MKQKKDDLQVQKVVEASYGLKPCSNNFWTFKNSFPWNTTLFIPKNLYYTQTFLLQWTKRQKKRRMCSSNKVINILIRSFWRCYNPKLAQHSVEYNTQEDTNLIHLSTISDALSSASKLKGSLCFLNVYLNASIIFIIIMNHTVGVWC